jgi:hypothetical protein
MVGLSAHKQVESLNRKRRVRVRGLQVHAEHQLVGRVPTPGGSWKVFLEYLLSALSVNFLPQPLIPFIDGLPLIIRDSVGKT